MPTVKHAIIAAAGMGTRLGLGKPKCLIELGGISLINHLLHCLDRIEDVRIVTGFLENDVISAALKIRNDLIFVRNPSYRSTTTLSSYVKGAAHIDEPCLFMDADIYFNPDSFDNFLRECQRDSDPIIAITKAKTNDAVYVECEDGHHVTSFFRDRETEWEWANLAFIHPDLLNEKPIAVFEQLRKNLPIKSVVVDSYEIDRPEDLKRAVDAYDNIQ